jgi:hypothetical protein
VVNIDDDALNPTSVVREPPPDFTGWSITDPAANAALSQMSNLLDGHGLYFDRRLRPITCFQMLRLTANPGYKIIRQSFVVDRLPPYLALKVSTVWIGFNLAPPGAVPQVFETMTFAASPSAVDTLLDLTVHRNSIESHALETHRIMVETVGALMGDPMTVPVRRRGKRADAKLWSGMGSRVRREAREFTPGSSGIRRVRGRGGKLDRYVTWTWRPEARFYHVEHQLDPTLEPVTQARQRRRRRRRR